VLRSLILSCLVAGLSLAAAQDSVPGRLLVKFKDSVPPGQANRIANSHGARVISELPGIGVKVISLPANANPRAMEAVFRAHTAEVEFAEPDAYVYPSQYVSQVIPNDPWFGAWQWALSKISCPAAWTISTGSPDIIIAVLDSGVCDDHEDLVGRIVPGWDVYSNGPNTYDFGNHGTLVCGTAGASTNNGIGVSSVTWGCKLMPIRICSQTGSTSLSVIAQGLYWAADHGARVANISWAPITTSSTVTAAAQYFMSRGGVVVNSSGNDGTVVSAPDNIYMVTVGATGPDDTLEPYSNRGNLVDMVAPGSSRTTDNPRIALYNLFGGTSVAAPYVSGAAALILSTNPLLSGYQVRDILRASADDLGPAGWDQSFGTGRLNVNRALVMAGGLPPSDSEPPIIQFGSPSPDAVVSGSVPVTLSATDNSGVASMNLLLDGTSVGSWTAANASYTWNTLTATNGSHVLTASAVDTAGNQSSTSITVTVNNTTTTDTTPPTITITAPTQGATIGTTVTVTVNAMDNVRVTRVKLYADGVNVASSTSAPFTTKWSAKRAARGAHTLQVEAYDAAGNVGASSVVTVYK
jgi:thermitase